MKIRNRAALVAACTLALLLPAVGFAQDSSIDEIVVTAQKREQSAQDVGISLTAISGDDITQMGYASAQEVTSLAAGVSTIQPNGESNYAIGIRGVANSDFTTNVESPVAIYVDEVYVSQMSGTGFQLFDMERVEILRGPQGTLFGRNATGGLAHFITKKPGDELDGYLKLTAGSHSQFKAEGAVGGPLIEGLLSARLSAAGHWNDGYIENRLGGDDLNNANDKTGRLQLLLTPSEDFSALLNLRASDQDIRTGFFEHVTSNVEGMLTPNEVNQVLGYIDNDGDPYTGAWDSPGHNRLETWGATLTLNWEFGDGLTLTSITDYSDVERDYIEDSDASPVPLFNFFLTTDAEQFSQEIRLAGGDERLSWVAGFYYLDLEVNDSNGAESEPFIDPTSLTPAVSGLDNPYTTTTESWSLFGQVEYQLSEQFKVTAGFRWIEDEKEHDYVVNAVDFIPGSTLRGGNPNILAQLVNYSGDRDDGVWSARLGFDWTPMEDVLFYASWNRGVKGGGFNAPLLPLAAGNVDATMSYAPEELDAFEIGFKTTLANGTLQINGSGYYYDYNDYQAFQIFLLDTITQNADATSKGAELETIWVPVEGLTVRAGAAYNDIEVDLGDGSGDQRSVQSPEWNLFGLVRWEVPLFEGTFAAQLDIDYRSEHFFSLTGLETVRENGYAVTNASVSWTSPEGDWTLTGFVRNLADEEYLVQTFDLSGPAVFGMTEQYFGRPRWFGVSVAYSF